ncbi:MAG: hypothetical protein OEY80_04570 [Nitrospirota bacterium]|nr:hypothetical protein [Nitrospirota bacterium]
MTPKVIVNIAFGVFLFICAAEFILAEEGESEHNVVGGAAGGTFSPFDGKTGFSGLGQLMFQISHQVRLGGEFEVLPEEDTK